MSERIPKQLSEAELEKERTINDAILLNPSFSRDYSASGKRGNYVMEKGGKRLEVTEEQIERARHEMTVALERQALRNEFLGKIGLESLEEAPEYDINRMLPEYRGKDGSKLNSCCVLKDAFENAGSQEWAGHWSEKVQHVLTTLYEKHPDLKKQKVFILTGDMGPVIVWGKKMFNVPESFRKVTYNI